LNAHSARWCRRFMLAAIPTILLAASLDRGEAEERKFMRLTGESIETKVSGKVLTDEVHWRDYFRKDGALLSNSMGRKTTGKWQVRGNELCLTEEGVDTCYQVGPRATRYPFDSKGSKPLMAASCESMKDHRKRAKIVSLRRTQICSLSIVFLCLLGSAALADDDDYDATKLIRFFDAENMPLDQALRSSEQLGQPISAKYDVNKGVMQLSVSIRGGQGFADVIFDHKSGSITKTQAITDEENLNQAQAHAKAMAKANAPLVKAIEEALKANTGYQAVRVVPVLAAGVVPVAMVTLIKGRDTKDVFEQLN
jgi:hypothetical protein